jgi:ring-1,2-phenylacetyl-CoA epoxidase subunit PaaE
MAQASDFKRLEITGIVRETNDAFRYLLKPLDGWLPAYEAGQFITLVFNTVHGQKRRSYSLSSSPVLQEQLSITVKKVDNGEFSRYMLNHLQVGDILLSSGISGLFTLPENIHTQERFCFLAAGSGIVPCFSMIKTLLQRTDARVTLIYSNRAEEDTIFYTALQQLEKEHSLRFQVVFLFSNQSDIYQKRLSKWLLEQLLVRHFQGETHKTLFYLCGPFEYMQTIEITLSVHTPKENVRKENFSSLPRVVVPEPPDKAAHEVQIHIHERVERLLVQYPTSILAAAKLRGIDLPYSCEAGRCSACIATCRSGKIWMAYNEVLVDKEIEKGRVLVCQSYPLSDDVEIVYD